MKQGNDSEVILFALLISVHFRGNHHKISIVSIAQLEFRNEIS